jgi:hypothetical protein
MMRIIPIPDGWPMLKSTRDLQKRRLSTNQKEGSMKTVIAILMTMLLGATVNATQKANEKEVQIGVSSAFVPGGFDSSSDAYVVVSGVFQNGCYRWNRAEVNNVDSYNHEIKTMATVTPGMCIMVLVPFQKDIALGKLDSGKHSLKFVNSDGTFLEKTMSVE